MAPFPQTRARRWGSMVRALGRLPREALQEDQGFHHRPVLKAGRSRKIVEFHCTSMVLALSDISFVCHMLAVHLPEDDMCVQSSGFRAKC